jgi:hypothetical protein
VVERRPEKAGVASSILAPGTTPTSAQYVPIAANPVEDFRLPVGDSAGIQVVAGTRKCNTSLGGLEHTWKFQEIIATRRASENSTNHLRSFVFGPVSYNRSGTREKSKKVRFAAGRGKDGGIAK